MISPITYYESLIIRVITIRICQIFRRAYKNVFLVNCSCRSFVTIHLKLYIYRRKILVNYKMLYTDKPFMKFYRIRRQNIPSKTSRTLKCCQKKYDHTKIHQLLDAVNQIVVVTHKVTPLCETTDCREPKPIFNVLRSLTKFFYNRTFYIKKKVLSSV